MKLQQKNLPNIEKEPDRQNQITYLENSNIYGQSRISPCTILKNLKAQIKETVLKVMMYNTDFFRKREGCFAKPNKQRWASTLPPKVEAL